VVRRHSPERHAQVSPRDCRRAEGPWPRSPEPMLIRTSLEDDLAGSRVAVPTLSPSVLWPWPTNASRLLRADPTADSASARRAASGEPARLGSPHAGLCVNLRTGAFGFVGTCWVP